MQVRFEPLRRILDPLAKNISPDAVVVASPPKNPEREKMPAEGDKLVNK